MQHFALCLEPPGNIGRDLSLFRRGLFRSSAEASALAFPDLAFLAWGMRKAGREASLGSPLALRRAVAGCLPGIDGRFSTSAPLSAGDCLFLGLEGPLAELCGAARSALAALGLEIDEAPPFPSGMGFFMLKSPTLASNADLPTCIQAPKLSFLDCHLSLIRMELGPDPFAAARWEQHCRVRRRCGA